MPQHGKCNVKQCYNVRHHKSAYCQNHARRKTQWGHPLGQNLPDRLLKPYIKLCADTVEELKETTQIQSALKAMTVILSLRQFSRSQQACADELQRLTDAGLSPEEALCIAGGVWLYYYYNKPYEDDARLNYMMAQKLLTSRPVYKRSVFSNGEQKTRYLTPNGTVRKTLGELLRDTFSLMFYNMAQYIEKQEQKKREQKNLISKPFTNEGENNDFKDTQD